MNVVLAVWLYDLHGERHAELRAEGFPVRSADCGGVTSKGHELRFAGERCEISFLRVCAHEEAKARSDVVVRVLHSFTGIRFVPGRAPQDDNLEKRAQGGYISERHESGDARGEVRHVGFVLAVAKQAAEALHFARIGLDFGNDRISLIAIADDAVTTILPHGVIHNETRICDLGRISRFGKNPAAVGGHDPVPAVLAAAGQEVDVDDVDVLIHSDHEAPARIGVCAQCEQVSCCKQISVISHSVFSKRRLRFVPSLL